LRGNYFGHCIPNQTHILKNIKAQIKSSVLKYKEKTKQSRPSRNLIKFKRSDAKKTVSLPPVCRYPSMKAYFRFKITKEHFRRRRDASVSNSNSSAESKLESWKIRKQRKTRNHSELKVSGTSLTTFKRKVRQQKIELNQKKSLFTTQIKFENKFKVDQKTQIQDYFSSHARSSMENLRYSQVNLALGEFSRNIHLEPVKTTKRPSKQNRRLKILLEDYDGLSQKSSEDSICRLMTPLKPINS
jgi:hypothetical protein